MRVLVIGRSGQLAAALAEQGGKESKMALTFLGRREADLADPASLAAKLESASFDLLINAAAYTAVDLAESETTLAMAVNAEAPGVLAGIADERCVPIIHLSTDFVFSGKRGPYGETDPTGPASVYGKTKLEGERRVAIANRRHLIVRTSWVHSPHGRNFVRTMLGLAMTRPSIRVVGDQVGNPTNALDLAAALLQIAADLGPDDARFGTYHLAGGETASWAGFAEAILAQSRAQGGPFVPVEAIGTAQYPTDAVRPADSRLSCRKVLDNFGIALPGFRTSLPDTVNRLLAQVRHA